jgi:glycosyltransferase involved in cell wall biosynthesis
MKKTLYINGKFLNQPVTGVQRFSINIIKNLDEIYSNKNPDFKVILLAPYKSINLNLKFIIQKNVVCFVENNHIWEQFFLPFYINDGILLNLSGSLPLLTLRRNIITIHDAAIYLFSGSYKFKFRLWYKILYRLSSIANKTIFTVSAHSKTQLKKIFKNNEFVVLYNSSEHFINTAYETPILSKLDLEPQLFLLVVASFNPTKNLSRLIEAFTKFNYSVKHVKLVVVGSMNKRVFSKVNFNSHLHSNVIFAGKLDDQDLSVLYKNALAFIFPSIHEGFGIPPLEAMKCGCPVLASDISSIPEVCGDAALYFNPYDIEDIASKMLEIYQNEHLKFDLVSRGNVQIKKFSWYSSAKKLHHTIKSRLN